MILSKEDFQKVYEILDSATPISGDCGKKCGALCCLPKPIFQYNSLLIYLLPGEDSLHDKEDPWLKWYSLNTKKYLFPKSWGKRFRAVRCSGPSKCKRNLRPIQCRTFPLMPYLTPDEKLQLILYNQPLPYQCPLITDSISLNKPFAENVRKAWKILLQDTRIFDYVKGESEHIRKTLDAIQVIEE